jgi:hypothetical protein
LPAAFSASGLVPGNPAGTTISGVVLDNSNNPVPGATLRAYNRNVAAQQSVGLPPSVNAVSDTQGQFTISGAPVGFVKLIADGSTVTRPGKWPNLEYELVTVAGQNNTIGLPIYLLPLNTANQLCVSSTTAGTLTIPQLPGFALTVAPGSATFPGGSQQGCITVTAVHPDKIPMVPGFGQQPTFIVTIQPAGTLFSPAAQITIPNTDGLAPRQVTEMYSFDHDLATFVSVGTATVSADGTTISSDPGVGVLKAGWYCGGPPTPTGTAAVCGACNTCNGSSCVQDSSQNGNVCSTPSGDAGVCQNGQCAPAGEVKITSPVKGTNFDISAVPQMPSINATAAIINTSPDLTSSTSFQWTAHITMPQNACPHGPAAAITLAPDVTGSIIGGKFTPAFTGDIYGGTLTLTASATLPNGTVSSDMVATTIRGTNPGLASVQSSLPHDTLRRIACDESGQMQFLGAPGEANACPYFSQDNLNGVGILQLTPFTDYGDDAVWDWTANISYGVTLFGQKVSEAESYPGYIRSAPQWVTLVNQVNQTRTGQGLPPITVTLPDFTSGDFNNNLEQLQLDSIRGFNGFAGNSGFTGSNGHASLLHEFRVLLNPAGPYQTGSTLVVDSSGNASWEEVPVAARPASGTPNYVQLVLAQDPKCP